MYAGGKERNKDNYKEIAFRSPDLYLWIKGCYETRYNFIPNVLSSPHDVGINQRRCSNSPCLVCNIYAWHFHKWLSSRMGIFTKAAFSKAFFTHFHESCFHEGFFFEIRSHKWPFFTNPVSQMAIFHEWFFSQIGIFTKTHEYVNIVIFPCITCFRDFFFFHISFGKNDPRIFKLVTKFQWEQENTRILRLLYKNLIWEELLKQHQKRGNKYSKQGFI